VGEKVQELTADSGVARIEERRCGDGGSTVDRAGAARFCGSEEVVRKLLHVDVVLG
jgi:hypothetical protein